MRTHHRDESGIAMLTALMVIFIATVLAVAALALANHSLNAAGIDRNRTQAIAAAEAGLDNAVYTIQNAGPTLPCTISGGKLPTSPATAEYSITVSYYSTNPPTGSALTCTGTPPYVPSTATPASAEIVSKAYSGTASATGRAMEALITLTPVGGLNDAIFGHQIITFSNNATITRSAGSTAPNSDLYTDGDYVCANNESVDGTVYAQGKISASNTCSVTGSWEAKGPVSSSGKSVVGGNVISTTSSVTLSGNTTVSGSIYGCTTATGGNVSGSRNGGSCGNTVPSQTFPQENFNASDWTSNGFVVVTNDTCSGSNSVYSDIANMSTASSDTVINTTCALSWGNNTRITLNHNLVIFSTQGFTTNNKVDFESTSDSTTHNLEWIVPYSQASSCSSSVGGITTSNLTTFGNDSTPPNIDVMFYTPCDVNLSNQQAMTGQIYSDGTVTVNNKYDMTFQQMPLYGVSGAPATNYIAEYDYKREVPYS